MQLVRDNSESGDQTPFYSTFTGPAVYTDEKKYQKLREELISILRMVMRLPAPIAGDLPAPWQTRRRRR